ncbi:MAG: universal stress protein, partial [Leptolyngbyaceae bacterium]|nr:universal stress protein [Leptolyngbyaceae bacterium]
RHRLPSETAVRTTLSRRLLAQATRLEQEWQIPVHTQIRVAHDVAQAILEAIKERHIDLTVMGWKGSTVTPGRVFGGAVDTVIRQADCEVVVVRLATHEESGNIPSYGGFDRWLLPIAGGPNAQQAIQLLPALTSLSSDPQIKLCQVFPTDAPNPDTTALIEATQSLQQRMKSPVSTQILIANSVSEAIVNLAQTDHCDVIMLGASREGLLQQAIKGNIPEAIARNSPCHVILVRSGLS